MNPEKIENAAGRPAERVSGRAGAGDDNPAKKSPGRAPIAADAAAAPAEELTQAHIDQAALAGFLSWLTEPDLPARAIAILTADRPRDFREIAAALGTPPPLLAAIVATLGDLILIETTEKVAAARGEEKKSGKAILDDIVAATPIDLAMTETLKKFASDGFQARARALLEKGGPREVGEIGALLNLNVISVQAEIGAALAAITGETVQIPLGPAGKGAIVEFRPAHEKGKLN